MIDAFDIDRLEAARRVRCRYASIRLNREILESEDCRVSETEKKHASEAIARLEREIAEIAKQYELIN